LLPSVSGQVQILFASGDVQPLSNRHSAASDDENQGTFAAKKAAKNPLDNPPETAKVPAIAMKNNPLTAILLGALTLSALASVVLCWIFIANTRELRTLETQVAFINNNRAVINQLLNETIEYSKKNAAIIPVLEAIGWKSDKSVPATPSKPATK
jgi:hypothetical protein